MDKGFYPNFKNLKCQASSGMKSNGIKVQLPNTLNIFPNSMIRFNVTSDNKQSNLRNNWQIFNRPNNAASKQP
jgi:hypothetical protein